MAAAVDQTRAAPPKRAQLRVLSGVHGTDKVYRLLAAQQPAAGTVVFFVGDQLEAKGLPHHVLQLQDPKQQAALMAAKFPGSNVAVVMPSRLEASFACFDHFLTRTTASGEPLGYHGQGFRAAAQLTSLLQDGDLWSPDSAAAQSQPAAGQPMPAAAEQGRAEQSSGAATSSNAATAAVTSTQPEPASVAAQASSGAGPTEASGDGESTGEQPAAAPGRMPVRLVGFSKSGVVLNQLLTELAEWAETAGGKGAGPNASAAGAVPDVSSFLSSIAELHYLDVGLNCRGCFMTDPRTADSLAKLPAQQQHRLRILFHGTPRQWDDPTRPWIGREAQRSVQLLRAAGLNVTQRKYFATERPSLLMHFKVIESMDPTPM